MQQQWWWWLRGSPAVTPVDLLPPVNYIKLLGEKPRLELHMQPPPVSNWPQWKQIITESLRAQPRRCGDYLNGKLAMH